MAVPSQTKLQELKNIGPKSASWLEELGIHTRSDLAAYGSVEVYRALKASGRRVSVILVYALEGALLDLHWQALPPSLKQKLEDEARA